MKNKFKKVLSIMLAAALLVAMAGCTSSSPGGGAPAGGGSDLKGAHVWVFKSQGNKFGDLMFEGFKEVIESKGGKAVNKSPAETTVTAQVQLLDELIVQGVASITISTNGDQGYDEVIKKALNAGINIVSADSEISPDLRTTHVIPTTQTGIGTALIQASVLIQCGIPYPEDGNLEKACTDALASYSGDEMKFGVLSASIDTPVQNTWIAKMKEELQKDMYKGKVNPELDIKYGNDVLTESTTQANAFITEDNVDVIISPTTIGVAAAGQALQANPNSKIKLTGLGLPSEMQSFMPLDPSDDEFSKICPFMMLWDVIDLGRVAGGASYAAYEKKFDGSVGSSFELPALGNYPARTFKAEKDPDKESAGTVVVVGNPYVFDKNNMKQWIDVL